VTLSPCNTPLIRLDIDTNCIPRKRLDMKINNMIKIRQIPINNFEKCVDLSSAQDVRNIIPSKWSSKIDKNQEQELILLGIFVLDELIGITYFLFDPNTATGYICE